MSRHLDDEALATTELLAGKVVARLWRHRASELALEFTDGTRLFVDVAAAGLELSISGLSESPG